MNQPAGRLSGKTAIVTGAARGIGKGIARLFAVEGARVVIADIDRAVGEATTEEIVREGGEAAYLRTDVTMEHEIVALIGGTVERFGRLDVLVNNAYWNRSATVVEQESADWDRGMSVMLRAVYLGSKYAIPRMLESGGGSIVNIASVHGLLAAPRMAVYDAAKAGVINLSRQIAIDFGPQGVRCNAICPGWIVTEAGEEDIRRTPAMLHEGVLAYPVQRAGRPSDIAYAALYLASDESSFVSGHALVVDGGLTAQLQDGLIPVFRQDYLTRGETTW